MPPLAEAVSVVPAALAETVTVGHDGPLTVIVAVLLFTTVAPPQLVARKKTVVVLVGANDDRVAVVWPEMGAFVPVGLPVNHCSVTGAVPATTAVTVAVCPALIVCEAGDGCEVNEAGVQTTPAPYTV